MGEKAQGLPGPLPVGGEQPGVLAGHAAHASGSSWPCSLHNPAQPVCPWGRWGQRQEPSATNPSRAGSSALQPAPCWAQPGAPRQESSALACWLGPPAFWDPSPPSQGSRTSGSVCRATSGEPAATGWTVFVNLLETSQYSPELHLLHALKLTVQATRMTLTDLAQYHVF